MIFVDFGDEFINLGELESVYRDSGDTWLKFKSGASMISESSYEDIVDRIRAAAEGPIELH